MPDAAFSQTLQDEGFTPQGASQQGSVLQVADGVYCQQQSIVNVIFVGEPGSRDWVLVDAGLYFSASQIRAAATELYGDTPPTAIVLTHGHFDHVGALKTLAEGWDVPVFAHSLELPYLTGQSSYPPPDPSVGGGAMSLMASLYPRGPIDLGKRVQPLPADGSVPGMPQWRWLPTPGHTPGHVSFFRDEDRTLIVGDAFVTTRQESAFAVATRMKQVWRPPAYFTQDWQAAFASIVELASLVPNAAITGHGLPMYGEQLCSQLEELIANWHDGVLPAHGRYIYQPAIANGSGTIAVPPPVFNRELVKVAGVACAAFAGLMILRGASRRR